MASDSAAEFASQCQKHLMQTIVIAPEQSSKTFIVPLPTLIAASSWFDRALNGRFVEGQIPGLQFPGVSGEVIEHFIFWLFHGKLGFTQVDNDDYASNKTKAYEHQMLVAVRPWIFAQQHSVVTLQNLAIRHYDWCAEYYWAPLEAIREAFLGTAKDSPLRGIIMRDVVLGLRAHIWAKTNGYAPEALEKASIPGLMAELGRRLGALIPANQHEHAGVEMFLVGP